MKFSKQQIKGMQDFIWNGFTDSESVGVKLEDVLTGARFCGVDLTDKQDYQVLTWLKGIWGADRTLNYVISCEENL